MKTVEYLRIYPNSFCICIYLKVWVGHTFRDLLKKRLLDFFELRSLNDIEDLFNLSQEHHLIGEEAQRIKTCYTKYVWHIYRHANYLLLAAGFGPELEQTTDHLHRKQQIS